MQSVEVVIDIVHVISFNLLLIGLSVVSLIVFGITLPIPFLNVHNILDNMSNIGVIVLLLRAGYVESTK